MKQKTSASNKDNFYKEKSILKISSTFEQSDYQVNEQDDYQFQQHEQGFQDQESQQLPKPPTSRKTHPQKHNFNQKPAAKLSGPSQKSVQKIAQNQTGIQQRLANRVQSFLTKSRAQGSIVKQQVQTVSHPYLNHQIEELIKQNRSIHATKIAQTLNVPLKQVLNVISTKRCRSNQQYLENILRENPRQRIIQLQKKLYIRNKIKLANAQINNIMRKKLRYNFICGRPARVQPIYDKKESGQVLNMRFTFCEFLRKQHYNIKDIYFCGLRMYSFEMKSNYVWAPQPYTGNLFEEYGDQKYKQNEVICLVTICYSKIVKADVITKPIDENHVIEHLRLGYLKQIAEKNNQKAILILSNTIPTQLYQKWKIEAKITAEAKANAFNSNVTKIQLSKIDFLRKKADLTKQLVGKMYLKKYLNEPPYSHKLNPLQGLFLKIDDQIKLPELQKLFKKDIMNIQLLQHQLTQSFTNINDSDCIHFYNPLQMYLTTPKLQPHMFLQKYWEDMFFQTYFQDNNTENVDIEGKAKKWFILILKIKFSSYVSKIETKMSWILSFIF